MNTHPLSQFEYCPRCGKHTFVARNVKANRCDSCGFVYYFNPSSACALLVTDEQERLLVAIRANEPARGSYDLPGGFVDLHETVEEAAIRELLEETGIDLNASETQAEIVTPLHYLFSEPNIYPYSGFEVHTTDLIFHIKMKDLSPYVGKGRDDVSELLLIPIAELNPKDFGLESISKVITKVSRQPDLLK